MSVIEGGSFWEGLKEGAIYGAINGFTTGALLFCAKEALSLIKCKGQCFAAGTLVLAKDEYGNECHKPIEEIQTGDKVWAYDEESGKSDWKEVVQVFRNETLVWHHIEVDGEEIVCTPEHPFYVLNTTAETPIVNFEGRDESQYYGQWVAAKYLKVGNKCLLSGGKTAIISKLEVEHLAEPETTYNFEVADFHTYYVGEKGILVHNDCPVDTPIDELSHTNGRNLSHKEFADLKADIKANGIQDPVKITEINGSKYIVDGNHRVAIARQLGMKTVPTQAVGLPYKGFATASDVIAGNTEYLIWRSLGGRW